MISLQALLPEEPFEVEVVKDLFFTVRPVTGFDMELSRVAAQKVVDDVAAGIENLRVAGLLDTALLTSFDPKNAFHRIALFRLMQVQELGVNHITAWRGVWDYAREGPAEPTAENIRRVLSDYRLSDAFFEKVAGWHAELLAAKKEFASAANGKQAEAPATAGVATSRTPPAPAASPATTESAAR